MRIISGKFKGKEISLAKGMRPTQDKVRKALFDILGDIEGLSFLELFAGSGAIGFEAASRGVRDLTLVEYSCDCLLAIKKNIEALKLNACNLYPQEAREAITKLHKDERKFDIIFLDPPYYLGLSKKTLQILEAYDILAPNGFIVVQHFKKDNLPDALGDLRLFKQAKYGDTVLSFYRKL
jgi:16S rRNA (guanine(966)-N(2))-methyltransferase RsmD